MGLLGVLLTLALPGAAQVKITVDHNLQSASSLFKFKNVPSPVRDDAAAKAKLALVDGEIDPNGADLSALVDGRWPSDEDEPQANFFFRAGSTGGRILIDFGSAIEIAQVNTYSWHSNTRGPQLYKLYASDGTDPNFNAQPKRLIDPSTCGWRLIGTISTLPADGEEGGQYGVSISDASGRLGRYRYLLFDCFPTEFYDNWGNTFYSEIDVLAKSSQTNGAHF
jgi:hypothetical protein